MTTTSLVLLFLGVTAAAVLSPIKAPKSGSGMAPAFAATGTTYSQHCKGWIVSSTDTATTCKAGPCTGASISTPELDFLNSSSTLSITGTSVAGNALSVSVSNNSEKGLPALKDNMFINPLGITLTGTIYNGTTTGTCTNPDPNLKPPQTRCIPVGCFVIQETGSVPGPPKVTFASNSAGCYSNKNNVFDSDLTLTTLTIGKTTIKEPIILHCHGENTSATPSTVIPPLAFKALAGGFSNPVGLEMPKDGSNRFFVVEQGGTIKILHQDGTVAAQDFLDIAGKVTSGGELGLLGVTFHPSYSTNGRFFVNYTRTVGTGQIQTVIAEYHVSSNPDVANPKSERILLTQNQPFSNHKAGQLAFGPDGFLYFGLGDGGSGGDPIGNGQNLGTLLGKMMRIDVNHEDPGLQYAIPADNPFATSKTALHEIWAYGFRNPWRFSFERGTGRQFCGDVGQNKFEEVDTIQKGGNFGWNVMEGAHCFKPPTGCDMTGKILPVAEYDHSQGTAIIGGYVYKGSQIPSLTNLYIFGDLSSGKVWYLREGPPGTFTQKLLLTVSFEVSSFGQDIAGEIYIVDYSGGNVLKLTVQ